MAIDSLHRALEIFGPPVYVFHEIVHNRRVVERFRSAGAVFVDRIEDVPEGGVLLFSAHGVSPVVRRAAGERRLRTIDATCPLVTKVHREAVRFAAEGYHIVLVGHASHDEIIGVVGEAPNRIRLVESVADVERLEFASCDRIAYLTQTTLSMDDAAEIIRRLKEKYPGIVGPARDDICYATQNRQRVVAQWCAEADVVLVVGSRNSSNSRRLTEIAEARGVPAHLVDGPTDLREAWFDPDQTVLVTAGASAPEDVVQQCVATLSRWFDAEVETRELCREEVVFVLPSELRSGERNTGEIDPP